MIRRFDGPLFIVGMPRSGTKLLRELLNNHSGIVFPSYESQILPFWSQNFHTYGDLKNFENFKTFYNQAIQHSFFKYMEKQRPGVISAQEWHRASSDGSLAAVFKAMIILDTHCGPETIWGDKTPSYITHIPLLKKIYPDARVIHIVRDVRDYCLSANKAWGKNMFRAAQRWQNDTRQASQDIRMLGQDGIEIRYEDLLKTPEKTMQQLCHFLGVPFEARMLTLSRPAETIGSAKGAVKIVKKNINKWPSQMSSRQIRKIERICAPQLKNYSYPVTYGGKQRDVSKTALKIYKLLDALNLLFHDTDKRGILKNLLFQLNSNRIKIRRPRN